MRKSVTKMIREALDKKGCQSAIQITIFQDGSGFVKYFAPGVITSARATDVERFCAGSYGHQARCTFAAIERLLLRIDITEPSLAPEPEVMF